MNFWQKIFGAKASQARQVLVVNQVGKPINTPRNYESFARQAYQINVIAFKCVQAIASACKGIEWELYQNEREVESHPLLDLIKKPNPMQAQASFMESLTAYYQIAGNSYVEAVRPSPRQAPTELWTVRPDKVRIIAGSLGLPQAFEFKGASKEVIYPVDQISGMSDLLHLKTFNPIDPWYGMSPIEAAIFSIDQHNEAAKWNLSMLQNSAMPSGALVMKQDANNPSGTLPEPQFNNLQDQLNNKYSGGTNAGRIMILEGGLDWKQMGLNQKDMDWLEGRNMSSRDIALAFGVPPIMLNIPGDSTFANYKEARLSMYEDTVIPLMDMIKDELNGWLCPMFGKGLELSYDKDSIGALESKRSEKFTSMSSAGFLTINEKREAVGYEPIEGGDVLLVNSGLVPLGEEPEETDNEVEADTGEEENTGDEVSEEASKHEAKVTQINLLNQREKRNTWKRFNELRDKLASAMYHDVKEDLDEQASDLKKALENVEPRVMEFAALKVLSDSSKLEATLRKHIKRALNVFGRPILEGGKTLAPDMETKTTVRFQNFVDRFIQTHTASAIKEIEGTSIKKARKAIKDIIAESQESGATGPEIAQQLEDKFKTISSSRATTIARTETAIAANNGSLEAAKALDIPDLEKEWVSVNDDRTRHDTDVADHLSANSQTVGLNEKFFLNPDTEMDGPGDPSAPAEQVINCRCVLVYKRNGKSLIPDFEVI